MRAAGENIYAGLLERGIDALLDDRDERAGVKFKDADLIGIPVRINVGRGVASGVVEVIDRRSRASEEVGIDDVVDKVSARCLKGP